MRKLPIDLSSVTTVGLDLAKLIFFVHGVDAQGQTIVAKALRRHDVLTFFKSLPPCLVGIEACGSSYHWARELIGLGHEVKLMPPAYVKPYVKRQKNDAADAAAICEAVTRPTMRFVNIRSVSNQAVLMQHKVRQMLITQRTQLLNGLRGHLAEVGVIAAQGPGNARALAGLILQGHDTIPAAVCVALTPLIEQLEHLDVAVHAADTAITQQARANNVSKRLMSIPGIGPITSSALAATIVDTSSFTGPREFAAYLGLVPRQNSSGGKIKLGRITKMGNAYLRKLLVVGAHSVLYHRAKHQDALRVWADKLMETKPFKLVAVAVANKLARIVFAIMKNGTNYSGRTA